MRAVLIAVGLSALIATPLAALDRTITVSGEGQVAAVPDLAMVRIGVSTDAVTAGAAISENSSAMQDIMIRLSSEGLAVADLQTSTLDLGPRYVHRPDGVPEIQGYTARNMLSIRVRDLDRLGGILGAVADEGANTFEGLSFDVSNAESLREEAMRLAVADARHKAQLLADEADVTLGQVISIDLGGAAPRPAEMYAMRMAAEAVPVARGELSIAASVRVVFALGQ